MYSAQSIVDKGRQKAASDRNSTVGTDFPRDGTEPNGEQLFLIKEVSGEAIGAFAVTDFV
jgi:hypothetical protein